MLSFFFVVFLTLNALAEASIHCANVTTTPLYTNCYVDLTIGIDMSAAMINTKNIAALDTSLLTHYLTKYDASDTYTSVITFGSQTVNSSDYYTNYEDICEYIHSAESQAADLGLYTANLSE